MKLEERLEEAPDDSLRELDVEASLQASNASPVVSLVDRILVQALERSADCYFCAKKYKAARGLSVRGRGAVRYGAFNLVPNELRIKSLA